MFQYFPAMPEHLLEIASIGPENLDIDFGHSVLQQVGQDFLFFGTEFKVLHNVLVHLLLTLFHLHTRERRETAPAQPEQRRPCLLIPIEHYTTSGRLPKAQG